MTGRATATAKRRRSLAAMASAVVAVAVVAGLAAACGSHVADPVEQPPESGAAAPSAPAGAAPVAGSAAGTPIAGDSAATVSLPPDGDSPQSVAPLRPETSQQSPPVQLDTAGLRSFPSAATWEALRQCESAGDYAFVHPSGQYSGAYQFTVATWDRLANQRYTGLLGILPSEAAPADQDRMAYYLWIESGHARWPACSHVFTDDPPPAEPVAVGSDPAAPPGDEAVVAGAPFEPAPGDHETLPLPPAPADPEVPVEAEGAPESPDDLPALEIDPSIQPAIPPDAAGFPTPQQWEALRFCESSGNYQAVNRTGIYFGAYQFWPDTWDFVARRNYPRLIGVLPSAATPQDQDRMAYRLYEQRGAQPWPVCGRYLVAATGAGSSG